MVLSPNSSSSLALHPHAFESDEDVGSADEKETAETKEPVNSSNSRPAAQQLRRGVSNKLTDKSDWNVQRHSPPLRRRELVLYAPLIFFRVLFFVLGLLQLILVHRFVKYVLYLPCRLFNRFVLRGGAGERGANTCCDAWTATDSLLFNFSKRLFLLCAGIVVRVHREDNVGKNSTEGHFGDGDETATSTSSSGSCLTAWSRQAPFMIANHVNYLDGFVVYACFPVRFVATARAAGVPFLGEIFRDADTVFVNRSSRESKGAVVRALFRRSPSPDHGHSWRFGERPLFVFPESTCTNAQNVIPLKKGVFVPGQPVRPCLIFYSNSLALPRLCSSWSKRPAGREQEQYLPRKGGPTSSPALLPESAPKKNAWWNDWASGHPGFILSSSSSSVARKMKKPASSSSASVKPVDEEDAGVVNVIGKDIGGGGQLQQKQDQNSSSNTEETSNVVAYSDGAWFLQFFCRLFLVCHVHVLPVVRPTAAEESDPELYASRVHVLMQEKYSVMKDGRKYA